MTLELAIPPERGADPELDAVTDELQGIEAERVAEVLRDTLDQLYDGQHTGRWDFAQLFKTEKTHMGTIVEINLQRAFKFADGKHMDYSIAGVDVDCKYSMSAVWQLPPEVMGQIALLVTADDTRSFWSAGLIRVEEQWLNPGKNRDAKRTLSKFGRSRIRPLWAHHWFLAPNLFLTLDSEVRERIFSAKARRGSAHGQARTNELFRSVQGVIIRRAELATVAQQDDFMKRARGNGGARSNLQPEGIVVLGHQENDPRVARDLGLPVPRKGELISARVVPAAPDDSGPTALIDGQRWVVARPGDPVVRAPTVTPPKGGKGRSAREALEPTLSGL
jgi:hypothetical protein